MTRSVGTGPWVRQILVVFVVSTTMLLVPVLQWPASAQQSWGPAPAPAGQPYGQPYAQPYGQPYGQPYWAPPPVDTAMAAAQAVADARADTSTGMWFLAGCLLNWVGIVVAYLVEPSPPPARMMGKSPEYLGVYLAAYKSEARSIQGHAAIWGTVASAALVVFLIVLLVHDSTTVNSTAAIMSSP